MIKALYVHIPFCKHICGYCDFVKCRYDMNLADKYLNALNQELSLIEQDHFYSAYIGGGTPTALSETQLERLLEMLSHFRIDTEYTIEINPETFNLAKAKLLKKYGINRVSIGVESFDDQLLEHMNRSHKREDIINTFHWLKEVGITNRSIDLMYGFNVQTLEGLLEDLEKAVCSPVTHISIYDLEVYPHTQFGINKYQKIDQEIDATMYETIIDFLNNHSYYQYETSNFALRGFESKHNKVYWEYEDYIGVGLGASGKIKNIRYDNTRNFLKYFSGQYKAEETRLSLDDIRFEALMMNLRLIEGIDIEEYNRRFDCSILDKYQKTIDKHIKNGMLEIVNNHLRATNKGKFILNDILVDFMD